MADICLCGNCTIQLSEDSIVDSMCSLGLDGGVKTGHSSMNASASVGDGVESLIWVPAEVY